MYTGKKKFKDHKKIKQSSAGTESSYSYQYYPRSLTKKVESFKTYMNEEEIDSAFISECHEREDHLLVESLQIEDFDIFSNVH